MRGLRVERAEIVRKGVLVTEGAVRDAQRARGRDSKVVESSPRLVALRSERRRPFGSDGA